GVRVWDTTTARQIRLLKEQGLGGAGCFSADGRLVVTTSADGVTVWETASGQAVQRITVSDDDGARQATLSPDGRTVATAGRSGIYTGDTYHPVRLWDSSTGKGVATLTGHDYFVKALAFAPDGRRLLSGSGDATALIWAVPESRPLPPGSLES